MVETTTDGREADGYGNDCGRAPEERYGMLRNAVVKFMWTEYMAYMKTENCEQSDVREDVLESTILYISRVDAWFMYALKCFCCEDGP